MQKPPLIWLNVAVFVITGLVSLIGVPLYAWYEGFDTFEIVALVVLVSFAELSITAGYHRLWSHRTYDAHPVLKFIFAIGGAFALQNSILHWSADHRVHHGFVDDNDKDPYSAKRGFWYSHIGWMLREYQPQRYGDYSNVQDLQKDPIVMWQHKHYLALTLLTNFGIPLLLGWWHGDIMAMLLMGGFLRLVISHHFTFFINSLAHIWGSQPYSDENTARDNGFLAFLTFGEGYHNFHHRFASDYRNGLRWWQWDPTKWLIRLSAFVGLASNLKKMSDERIEKARLQMQLKRAEMKLARLPGSDEVLARMRAEYDALLARMQEYYKLKKELLEARKQAVLERCELQKLREQLEDLQAQFRHQQYLWRQFVMHYA